jgi:hypothetical protein
MCVRKMNNVVDAELDRFSIYWRGSEDVSVHEALYFLLSTDPTMGLHEF